MLSLALNAKTELLRHEFEKWLTSNPPPKLKANSELSQFVDVSRRWQQKLSTERWVAVHWPQEFGGRGLSLIDEAVIQEVLAQSGSPQLVNLFGLTMVGPVLIKHGTPAQQKRFLPKIISAEEIWCQGFSEPEAGSDLASLKTIATKDATDGNKWFIRGQKIWTSFAQYAEWCFVLVRTDQTAPKHKGLSYFLVPMNSAGIKVSPLKQISGDEEFNEVFFDNTPVNIDTLVGELGSGWNIAISTLMYERVILTFSRHLQSEQALAGIAKSVKLGNSTEHRKQYGRLAAKNMSVRALALSHLSNYSNSVQPGPEGSLDKLAWSETFQEICQFALKIQRLGGLKSEDSNMSGDSVDLHRYLYSRGRTIAAGTSEVQRNIIAERVLELPKK